jgi:hypothetical protein
MYVIYVLFNENYMAPNVSKRGREKRGGMMVVKIDTSMFFFLCRILISLSEILRHYCLVILARS